MSTQLPNADQTACLLSLEECKRDRSKPIAIVTGEAGTGKTSLIKFLTAILGKSSKTFSIHAPTGRASRIIARKTCKAASTIHSLIYEIDTLKGDDSEDYEQSEFKYNGFELLFKLKNANQHPSLYIIDESSMIGDHQFENSLIQFGTGRLLHDLLHFTGIINNKSPKTKILFIGDSFQLPPIGSTFSPALCKSHFLNQYKIDALTFQLSQVMRQAEDSLILTNARRLRNNISSTNFDSFNISYDDDEVRKSNAFSIVADYDKVQSDSHVIITKSNKAATTYNNAIRSKLFGQNSEIQANDILLVTKNTKSFLNGDLLRVMKVSKERESKHIRVKGLKEAVIIHFRKIIVRPEELKDRASEDTSVLIIENLLSPKRSEPFLSNEENFALFIDFRRRNKELKINTDLFTKAYSEDPYVNALSVKYGYALTCHKAQGGEWENVAVSFEGHFKSLSDFQWAYTAFTRAKSALQLINPPEFGNTSDAHQPISERDAVLNILKMHISKADELDSVLEYLSKIESQTDDTPQELAMTDAMVGKAWNFAEDSQLQNEFTSGMKVNEIALIHKRTHGAIRSRLVKLGLVDPNRR